MPRRTKADKERAERCRYPGCVRPWFTTFSPVGPVCLQHLPQDREPLPTIPTTPAAKPWSDTEKDDDDQQDRPY